MPTTVADRAGLVKGAQPVPAPVTAVHRGQREEDGAGDQPGGEHVGDHIGAQVELVSGPRRREQAADPGGGVGGEERRGTAPGARPPKRDERGLEGLR